MDNSGFGVAPASAPERPSSAEKEFAKLQLHSQIKSGANWFYWIAGLSLVNTIAALSGTNWRFILGLMLTQVIDVVASELGSVGKTAGLVADLFLAGIFVVFGLFAGKAQKWAFITGMVVFALDTCLAVLGQDWFGIIFHAYALWAIWTGLRKISELRALEAPEPPILSSSF
jgi:hypothetical protein